MFLQVVICNSFTKMSKITIDIGHCEMVWTWLWLSMLQGSIWVKEEIPYYEGTPKWRQNGTFTQIDIVTYKPCLQSAATIQMSIRWVI